MPPLDTVEDLIRPPVSMQDHAPNLIFLDGKPILKKVLVLSHKICLSGLWRLLKIKDLCHLDLKFLKQ